MSSMVPEDAPKPRLCHMKRWPDFNGYGFNLHAEKGKVGQYIGKVDDGSPAHLAGLRESDRIVAVNGTNIGNENHGQVVERIKAVSNETKLLVVDDVADDWYKTNKIVIRDDMPNILVGVTPEVRPAPGEVLNHVQAEENHPYKPRLCHVKIWPDFSGYGFNLHAEKNNPGQFIGKVDSDSPAEMAGLRDGDLILEVNGDSIVGSSHQICVSKIKAVPGETKLFVVDAKGNEYFKNKGITLNSNLPYVEKHVCPDSKPTVTNGAVTSSTHHARLCTIRKWADFQGYGFNMHCIKGKVGEFIGKVEAASPALAGGLHEGDRVVEVNGVNIERMAHGDVIGEIKKVANETQLLVVGPEADHHFQEHNVTVMGAMPDVETIECPESSRSAGLGYTNMGMGSSGEEHKARLCHLKQWHDYDGFGFNLHQIRNRQGEFASKIEPGSPAELAGLTNGDRVIEVNGVNIEAVTHEAAIDLIRAGDGQARLLVVDDRALNYFLDNGVRISGDMADIEFHECPDHNPQATTGSVTNGSVDDQAHQARLCHIRKWTSYDGYGFNIHSIKGSTGEYVGSVEEGSPAEAGGLREMDRVVEINGVNIEGKTHGEVIDEVRAVLDETRLLVLDPEADRHFSQLGVTLTSDSPASVVQLIVCPPEDEADIPANGTAVSAVHVANEVEPVQMSHEYQNGSANTYEHQQELELGAESEPEPEPEPEPEFEPEREPEPPAVHHVYEPEPELAYIPPPQQEPQEPEQEEQKQQDEEDRYDGGVDLEDVGDYEQVNDTRYDQNYNEAIPKEHDVHDTADPYDLIDDGNSAPTTTHYEPEPEPEPQQPVYMNEPARPPSPVEVRSEPTPFAAAAAAPTTTNQQQSSPEPVVVGGIEFAPSLEEARKRVVQSSKKKRPTAAQMSARDKYELFQRL